MAEEHPDNINQLLQEIRDLMKLQAQRFETVIEENRKRETASKEALQLSRKRQQRFVRILFVIWLLGVSVITFFKLSVFSSESSRTRQLQEYQTLHTNISGMFDQPR